MKVVIIGGVAGGASTAARLRRLDEHAQIIMFERSNHISFANCGIPYFCGGVIKDRENLLVQTPEKFKKLLNVDSRVNSEVIAINRENKTVTVKNTVTDEQYEESYDKLVLSPGASPIKPAIEGIDDERIFTVRNIEDADSIKNFMESNNPQTAVVIGGGFIGVEMAENLAHQGLKTSIIEMSDQIMNQIDFEMAAQVQNHLRDKGISLYLGDGVKSFVSGEKLVINLNGGKKIDADLVILSIGVKPEVTLAKQAGLSVGKTGGILVDESLRTNDENIYALGDAIEVKNAVSGVEALIPLASPANRQGRIVAENIVGLNSKYPSTLGTAIVKVFDMTVASTGLSEKYLLKNEIPYLKSYTQGFSHATYYPEAFPLMIKLLFAPDGKILGAQSVGLDGVDKRIDVIATEIKFGGNVRDLIDVELSYAPPFGSAKDPVNIAGMVAENILTKKVKMAHWDEIHCLAKDENTVIIDVRSKEEQEIGRFEFAINIPLEQLRERIAEIPKDKRIITHCTRGFKSYLAARILIQERFNVYSLSGGYALYKQIELNKVAKATEPNNLGDNKVKQECVLEIDACGLQCPGPIVKLSQSINNLQDGEVLNIKTTDPGFKSDVSAWCNSSGNTLISLEDKDKIISAQIQKGQKSAVCSMNYVETQKKDKTIVVFSKDLDKALATFIIANGAAAAGRQVTLFFTFWGLNILRKSNSPKVKKGLLDKMFGMMMPKGPDNLTLSKLNMGGLGTLMMKHVMKQKNVATLQELIEEAKKQGVRLIACQMSLDVMGIKPEELIDGVEVAGVASYINSAEASDMNLFI